MSERVVVYPHGCIWCIYVCTGVWVCWVTHVEVRETARCSHCILGFRKGLCHLLLCAVCQAGWVLASQESLSLTVGLQMYACSILDFKRVPGFERSPPSPHCFIFPYGIGLMNEYSTSSIPLRWRVSLSCGWRPGGGAREASRLPCNTMAVLVDPKKSSLAIRLLTGRFNPNWWSWR